MITTLIHNLKFVIMIIIVEKVQNLRVKAQIKKFNVQSSMFKG